MRDYPTLLNIAYDILQQKELLPEKFLKFERVLDTLPPEISPEVSSLFLDINQQIDNYKEQYSILVRELGVLSSGESSQKDVVYSFFLSLLDLFKLAYTTYTNQPEKLQPFHELLNKFVGFLETNRFFVETSLEKGLLLELTKSAWSHTKSQHTIQNVAKQVGGRVKNHTRKQKRNHKRKA